MREDKTTKEGRERGEKQFKYVFNEDFSRTHYWQ